MAAGAHQRHRELAGKDLVIGEPLARRGRRQQIGLGFRGMRPVDRIAPRGPAAPLPQRRIDPFRQCRQAVERRPDRLLHNPRGEARCQRINRLDQLEAVELVRSQYEVWVRHLRHAAVELDAAADDALRADRE